MSRSPRVRRYKTPQPPERRPFRGVGWLVVLLLFLLGSGMSGGALSVFRASPPAAPPTATPHPPTATPPLVPTATSTVAPSPTALPPPQVQLTIDPPAPTQGQTVVLRVQLDRAAVLSGDFIGRPLQFFYSSPTEAWALFGIPADLAVGSHQLLLTATAPEGAMSSLSQPVEIQTGSFFAQQIPVPAELSLLLVPEVRSIEEAYLRERLQLASPAVRWEAPFGIPSQGQRTSPYGASRSYAGGPVVSYHGGVDYAAPLGTGIFAAAPGRVALAERLTVRGATVIVDHGMGVYTLYAHLSEIGVQVGQEVARGDWLGGMGSSGLSTGSHLHWEVRVGDVAVDPDEWVSRSYP